MNKQTYLILFCCIYLVSCGGGKAIKPTPTPPSATATKPGGYYLDDGPGDNPPQDIDSIPNAVPKKEPLLERANKPYKALDMVYTPMTSYQPYKQSGVASWYGKRYHGKNTSSGEVYDMYSMSAAHTTLPLPSYVKVTNPANGRFVVVRINDRGPFKSDRIIDLSYAAAYKLRFSTQGSTLVQVEAIDASNTSPSYIANYTQPAATAPVSTIAPVTTTTPVAAATPNTSQVITTRPISPPAVSNNSNAQVTQYFVQAGAFKNESNAESLVKKIQNLGIEQNASINKVYNNGLYRLKLGPYDNKQEAEQIATSILKQLNLSTITTNQ
jgi:rare lipoprotein A